jgi:hypothetical protein
MNSNDNLGNLITLVQVRGENYKEWARTMQTSLHVGKKWGFVEGTATMLKEDSPEIEEWWTVQSMLVSWVLNTVEPTLRSTISYRENVQDLWEDMKERFFVMNGPRIQQLKSDLAGRMQGRMMVVAYYGKAENFAARIISKHLATNLILHSNGKNTRKKKKSTNFLGLDDTTNKAISSSLL